MAPLKAKSDPVCAYLVGPTGGSLLSDYGCLADALDDLRNTWNEEPTGPQTVMFCWGETENVAALMTRGTDPEVAITLFPSGHMERHRCRYVLTPAGGYDHTEVSDLDRPGVRVARIS